MTEEINPNVSPATAAISNRNRPSGSGQAFASWPNLPLKTAGGLQLWTDHLWRDGFRIQQHALTSHWRLLDPANVRQAWGARAACEAALAVRRPTSASDTPSHVTLLLHGLGRTHHAMKPMGAALTQAGLGPAIRFAYASSRRAIGDHARALRALIESLPPATQLSFVGHSLGNIVVRAMLRQLQLDGDPHRILPRCRSMVMLGPPNQGSSLARLAAGTGVYGWITGVAGLELGPRWHELRQQLATPTFPFAILAGDRSDKRLRNPLINRASDEVVTVEETRLPGSESLITLPVGHTWLMSHRQAIEATVDFLGHRGRSPGSQGAGVRLQGSGERLGR